MHTILHRIATLGLVLFAVISAAALNGCAHCTATKCRASLESDAPRVLMVLTSHGELGDTGEPTGFYLSEFTHPYHVFTEAGYQIDVISPKGGKAPMDGVNREDPINAAFLADPDLVAITEHTRKPRKVHAKHYNAIFFAGGHGTMWDFPNNTRLQSLTADIYEQGGVVAAVCHGPAGLVNVTLSDGSYLVAGKRVNSFTDEEERAVAKDDVVPFMLETKLRERGGVFSESGNFESHVVVDGRLVTGQNPASATGVAEAVVELLTDDANN